ncbi:hypothetical protein SRABI04_01318 [Chryseobacterium sp. Bi04]|nr:hypothetical protein SRABI04_01318 [Chryseobacterium sp. Bi04]
MKNNFRETDKLPLTFTYAEIIKKTKKRRKSVYFLTSSKFQTDFLTREQPYKSLIRLL